MASKPHFRLLAFVVGCAALFSCGDNPTDPVVPPPPPDPPRPTTLSISPATIGLSALGETAQLMAEVRDQNGRPLLDAEVVWSSSDPAVATVDATGLVTAAGNGEATVTARSGGVQTSAPVSVHQSAASVTISPDRLSLEAPGDTARLSATVRDARNHAVHGAAVAWSGYPYFESGILIVSSAREGLFVLRLQR